MLTSGTDNYLGTRVAILRSRLLADAEIDALIDSSEHQGPIGSLLANALDPDTDTASLERTLMSTLLADVSIILRPLTGVARDFFLFWSRRFELFNLKALIRGKLRGLSESEIERHLQEMPIFSSLNLEALLRAEGVAELLRMIEAGPYADIARQARQALEDKQNSLAAEAAIDQRYYRGLIKRVHQLPKKDADAMHQLMGVQVDRLNITWLLRFRFAYHLSPTETFYYLIRHGRYLNRETMLRLVELDDRDAVVAALPQSLSDQLTGVGDRFDAEHALEDLVRSRARQAATRSGSVVTRALAYLLLRECELNRLRAIALGHRLHLPPELMHYAVSGRSRERAH